MLVQATRAEAVRLAKAPLVAIGGITPENAPILFHEGFAGIAVCGAVWDAPDPAATLRALIAASLPH